GNPQPLRKGGFSMMCSRPGCAGTIEDDGYCNTCGHKSADQGPRAATATAAGVAAGTAAIPVTTGPTPGPSPTLSSSTAASSQTGSLSPAHGPGSTRTTGRPSSRGNLGAGLVDVPPVESRDPASVVMVDPEVAESKRYCAHCDGPV